MEENEKTWIDDLKEEIDTNIKPNNHKREITGTKLNATLKDMVDGVTANVSNQSPNEDGKIGYLVLKPQVNDDLTSSFSEQIKGKTNYIFEIRDVFELGETPVAIPSNCTLKFNGGMLKDGTISGTPKIEAASTPIFSNVSFSNIEDANVSWFANNIDLSATFLSGKANLAVDADKTITSTNEMESVTMKGNCVNVITLNAMIKTVNLTLDDCVFDGDLATGVEGNRTDANGAFSILEPSNGSSCELHVERCKFSVIGCKYHIYDHKQSVSSPAKLSAYVNDCEFTGFGRMAIYLRTYVAPCYINGNYIHDGGVLADAPENEPYNQELFKGGMGGIRVGSYEETGKNASGAIITNNRIENIACYQSIRHDKVENHGIICYGENITIENNTITNFYGLDWSDKGITGDVDDISAVEPETESPLSSYDLGYDSEAIYVKGGNAKIIGNYIKGVEGRYTNGVITIKGKGDGALVQGNKVFGSLCPLIKTWVSYCIISNNDLVVTYDDYCKDLPNNFRYHYTNSSGETLTGAKTSDIAKGIVVGSNKTKKVIIDEVEKNVGVNTNGCEVLGNELALDCKVTTQGSNTPSAIAVIKSDNANITNNTSDGFFSFALIKHTEEVDDIKVRTSTDLVTNNIILLQYEEATALSFFVRVASVIYASSSDCIRCVGNSFVFSNVSFDGIYHRITNFAGIEFVANRFVLKNFSKETGALFFSGNHLIGNIFDIKDGNDDDDNVSNPTTICFTGNNSSAVFEKNIFNGRFPTFGTGTVRIDNRLTSFVGIGTQSAMSDIDPDTLEVGNEYYATDAKSVFRWAGDSWQFIGGAKQIPDAYTKLIIFLLQTQNNGLVYTDAYGNWITVDNYTASNDTGAYFPTNFPDAVTIYSLGSMSDITSTSSPNSYICVISSGNDTVEGLNLIIPDNVTKMNHGFDSSTALESVILKGGKNIESINSMFKGCTNLTEVDMSGFNPSALTDLRNLFRDCSSLTDLDISGLDTLKLSIGNNSYGNTFGNCYALENFTAPKSGTCVHNVEIISAYLTIESTQSILDWLYTIETYGSTRNYVVGEIAVDNSTYKRCKQATGGADEWSNSSYWEEISQPILRLSYKTVDKWNAVDGNTALADLVSAKGWVLEKTPRPSNS